MNIKLGGLKIEVKYVPSNELEKDCGQADFALGTIKINKDLSKENKDLTLLHEILHHIDPALTESQIELYSRALYQVLHDNKLKF